MTYTLTTYIPDHGFTRYEVRTLEVLAERDGCRETRVLHDPQGSRELLARRIGRADGARVLRLWRRWAAGCPDQELERG
jgi:hypothetical protein